MRLIEVPDLARRSPGSSAAEPGSARVAPEVPSLIVATMGT